MTHSSAPQDPVGADERPRWALVEEAGGGLRGTWLLSACAPLCVPGVAPVVVVPVVWRPLALVLIVLVPLLGILGRNQDHQVVLHPDPHLAPPLTPLLPRVARGAVITAETQVPRQRNQDTSGGQVTDLIPHGWAVRSPSLPT